MKIRFSLFFLVFLLLTIVSCSNENDFRQSVTDFDELKHRTTSSFSISTEATYSPSDWQSRLTDTTNISSLLLPGTHDSGAYSSGGPLAITQKLSIVQQLEHGVRALDVRGRAFDDEYLAIYHGIISQNMSFEKDILAVCIDFLKRNPSEFLIISMKKEGADINSPKGYASVLRKIISKDIYKPYILQSFDKNLSVKDMRGKILFVHRNTIGAPFLGGVFFGWRDNTTFKGLILADKGGTNTDVFIEDKYKVPTLLKVNDKWSEIKSNLKKSLDPKYAKDWFITYASGTGIFAYPISIANRINPRLSTYLSTEKRKFRGILFLDFVGNGKDKNIVKMIVNNNFVEK